MLKTGLVSVSLIASASAAQGEAGLPHAGGSNDEIIVTASRVPLTDREVGSAFTLITDAQLRQGQTTFVKDVFQDVPGMQVTTDRPGDITSVSIRGSDTSQVLYLVDGIELGDPSPISTQFQAEHLVSSDIARIEILRGNQSSLYGSDAIGGVVNIITKRATGDGIEVNAEAEYGTYDTLNGGVSLLGRSGPIDGRVTATGYRHEGPSLARNGTEWDGYWRYGLSGRIGFAPSDAVDLQFIGFWQDTDTDLDNTTSDSEDSVRKKEWAAAARGTFKAAGDRLHVDTIASRYVARRRHYGEFFAAEGDVFEGVKDALSLSAVFDADRMVSLAAGGSYEEESTDQTTLYSGRFEAKATTRSAFAEVALRPVQGITLTGAARLDDNSRFGSFDTYRITGAYIINDPTGAALVKLRASYGTGAKAPGLYQLFDPIYGNPDLKVEKSRGGDVGVDFDFDGRLVAQLSYFFARTRNEIVFDTSLPPFGGYAQYGKTRASGIEAALILAPTSWISVRQSYTYLNSDQDAFENGEWRDIGRPAHSGSTALTLTPAEPFSFTARARYRGRNAASYGGVTDGYHVVDLLGSFDLTDKVQLYGRVVNLFDSDYQVSFGQNPLGRSLYAGLRVGI